MDEPTRQLHLAVAALPNTPLRHVATLDGQREMWAGDELIFRHADSPAAIAYTAALDIAVAAKQAMPASGMAREVSCELERLVDDVLRVVTRLHPTFSVLPVSLLAKLLIAGLEQQRSSPFAPPTTTPGTTADQRRDAVSSFCEFLLTNGDSFDLPSEQALRSYAERWNALRNIAAEASDHD